ncbi:MAG: gliding motility-associated C-terminal domain-containing protein [Bacteroidales bacterium]|nr:gliding motility-associated C-terminal domain-containing protein [Bacteroidales bacterium]
MTHKIAFLLLLFLTSLYALGQPKSYIIPDIGTPGYNTYVEIIALKSQYHSFGNDGFYLNDENSSVRVICTSVLDTNKVIISPINVSWHGRLIGVHFFIKPGLIPNSSNWSELENEFKIPISVVVNSVQTNIDTFYIVAPQSAIVLNSPQTIGSSTNTIRSRAGAIIVDSIQLSGVGTYNFSTQDCDPFVEGNQSYLPINIISLGNVSISSGTILSVNASGKDAGAGGGGGGAGSRDGDGGSGFTSGGFSCKVNASTPNYSGESTGLIIPEEENDSLLMGNYSINGIKGGIGFCDQGAGGGTGHPFGSSGRMGPVGIQTPELGGYGAGSAGGEESVANPPTYGGGGGGNAHNGDTGEGNASSNGGRAHGNQQLSPLFGGSGGGAGNVWALNKGGSGGGGGGAISIYTFGIVNIEGGISSNGSNGLDGVDLYAPLNTCSGGGGGAGGAVILGAKHGFINNANITVDGGLYGLPSGDGSMANNGGNGSDGRIRTDGFNANNVNINSSNPSIFEGPSFYIDNNNSQTFTLIGSGNGNDLKIYIKPQSSHWYLDTILSGYMANTWTCPIEMSTFETHYIIVSQTELNALMDTFNFQSNTVYSQAAAEIFYVATNPIAINDTVYVNANETSIIHNQNNDIDFILSGLKNIILTPPFNGNATVLNDSLIEYIPNLNFLGIDSIKYIIQQINDPTFTDTASIYINVVSNNTSPFEQNANNDTIYVQINSNQSQDICLNLFDNEQDSIEFNPMLLPTYGSILDTNPDDSCFTFQPQTNYIGNDTMCLMLCDNNIYSLCDTLWIVINITDTNNAPVITNNGLEVDTIYFELQYGEEYFFCIDAFDPDNEMLSYQIFSTPENGSLNNISGIDSCYSYIGEIYYLGADTFAIVVCDNHWWSLCDTIWYIVNIVDTNSAPVITDNGLEVDTIYFITDLGVEIQFCIEAYDQDSDSIHYFICSNTNNSTIFSNSNTDSCFVYKPNNGFIGCDTLNICVCDNYWNSSCDNVWVIITVNDTNVGPEIIYDGILIDTLYFSTETDSTLEFCFSYVDANNDEISSTISIFPPNGEAYFVNNSDTCIKYTSNENFIGFDTLAISVCDNALYSLCDVLIVIIENTEHQNSPLVALNDTIEVKQNQTITFNPLDNDYNLENQAFEITRRTNTIYGALTDHWPYIDYKADENFIGIEIFKYKICETEDYYQCDSAYIIIKCLLQENILIANAISPNNDGFNDYWHIEGIQNYENVKVQIINRWGNLVFESEDYQNNWNGQYYNASAKSIYNQSRVPDGTYYYIVEIAEINFYKTGFIIVKE